MVHGDDPYRVDGKRAVARVDAADGSVAWRTGIAQDVIRPLGDTARTVVTMEKSTAGGYVVVGRALSDGQPVWQHAMASGRRFAAMSGGTVFAVLPGDRRIVALRATEGEEPWRAPDPAGFICDLYAYGGTLFGACEAAGVSDTNDAPHRLTQFRPSNGAVRWLATTPYEIEPIGLADGDFVALGCDSGHLDKEERGSYTTLARIDATSRSLRTTPITGIDLTVRAGARLVDGVVCFTRSQGQTDAVDAHSGRPLWSRPKGVKSHGVAAAPVVNSRRDDAYFVTSEDRLTALAPRTGRVKRRGPDRPVPAAARRHGSTAVARAGRRRAGGGRARAAAVRVTGRGVGDAAHRLLSSAITHRKFRSQPLT
ncbi:PQQ-binding-like beta-propeller repeat protein [Streptomyces sp. VRA16 Mangrove soil]|uniref:outer membrane protein assembly factor BamB family protein n=1 Tax=Streptomyces sp. VRA16 Mangrove soil TaxID=2817434 RepID=UPI001A9E41C6|nr:PQQ-binding-like beta-propeller repeat protein [Streptomyces sp. VRA16 Mangrove soil]MBO1330896.1 PQQ-binding-like beta-propeller repeat protein [Streptomyces sp. VRA16 Mangrove soil]